ncbi:signal transducing adapter molecule 1-like isoform X2 [Cimex lectularius]|uniref:Signal transducing adapter molecule 1 n=1 Tax=Cimex lectularius TaxID=79782 RepID=A0A8I6SQH4_CIMLE|nr:signal transducing adapter molecule 1-like isoform X2 [Cimex lectularius]
MRRASFKFGLTPRARHRLSHIGRSYLKRMGLTDMFATSPFDAEVEKATNENNTSEDWGRIMEICDKVSNSSVKAKDCLRSIVKRLQNQDPHIVLQAITLLDACINNCGKTFQLEVASRDFDSEMKKVVKRWLPSSPVGGKLRVLIKKWSESDLKNDDQLSLMTSMWSRMRSEGIDLTIHSDPSTSTRSQRSTDPNHVSSQQEVDDIAKAIELSLKESTSPKTQHNTSLGTTSLYPSIGTSNTQNSNPKQSEPRKVRALYDFEAAEDNELTFFAGEIVHVTDDSDVNWWRGCNQRGEGLFPANFVTSDLSVETEKKPEKKGISFNETVEVKTIRPSKKVEIDAKKIDLLLGMLHEVDPTTEGPDPEELLALEEEVTEMGPLIDAELERVDRKHAQLSELSGSLVEALGIYHTLMREPMQYKPMYQTLPPPGHYPPGQQQLPHYFNFQPPPPPQQHINPGPPPPHFNGNINPQAPPHFPPHQPLQHFQPPPPPQPPSSSH